MKGTACTKRISGSRIGWLPARTETGASGSCNGGSQAWFMLKTICLACILVVLTAILYGCERSDRDKQNRTETRINSVASLKKYSVGKWCVLNRENDRLMKIVVGNSGRYVLYYKVTASDKNWERMRKGTILYGQGRYATDGAKYYYIHLSGHSHEFWITAGTPVDNDPQERHA